ncbi:unnamed protein product [Mytilus edulis]|uniref:Short-chain collagen C4 n=1 Tax=Mytilus edulis TaxID=6550 RepID=A0A8S3TL05_MYTED|nr:unnamed protein product [Mytilus edulis]
MMSISRANISGKNCNGYAAGEKHYRSSSYRGGASNMLCLPNNPELSDKSGSGSSFIFGTEFEGNQFASDSNSKDVPCVLCRSSNTASSVMIPGRKTCYAGWKEEYNGILASSAYSHAPSPYICVDANPTYVKGGQQNKDEHLLYATSMKCGSLPCPPYKDNVQVYCVVCYAAGEKYNWGSGKGGASNMLCLANNPELGDKAGSGNSFIFGTEFQGNDFASDSTNEDVPCALCRSSNTSSVMNPGRKTFYAGWKEEYNGILAASAYSHAASPYICVDANPTYVKGGQRDNNEHLLYVTAMKCGSLPCPPYKDNVQVYCVVCSK